MFRPAVTNRGICYAFNSPSVDTVLSPESEFFMAMAKAYGPEIWGEKNGTKQDEDRYALLYCC